MSRLWAILKREYLENVRTKAFLIGLVLTPVWMGVIFLVPLLRSAPERQSVVIIDQTGVLATPLQDLLGADDTAFDFEIQPAEGLWDASGGESRLDALKRQAGQGEVMVVVLTTPILEKRRPSEGEHASEVICASSAGASRTARRIQRAVNEVVTAHVLKTHEIPQETADLVAREAIAQPTTVGKEGEKAGIAQAIMPFIMMMMLYLGIMGISQMLISSTLEEKTNRVFEVLLSSVSPFQLMAGKILGVCGVGLTLLLLWSGGGLVAASVQGLGGLVTGGQIGWFLVYYLLGFLMIASLMVAIGSACNTIKEAQNLMAPISMLLVLPLILSMTTMENPNGTLATVASFIPPFTPFLMMARMAGAPGPPEWQIWVTLVLLIVATYATIRLAARVFRVGILLYGQPPGLRQIWRWMWERD